MTSEISRKNIDCLVEPQSFYQIYFNALHNLGECDAMPVWIGRASMRNLTLHNAGNNTSILPCVSILIILGQSFNTLYTDKKCKVNL